MYAGVVSRLGRWACLGGVGLVLGLVGCVHPEERELPRPTEQEIAYVTVEPAPVRPVAPEVPPTGEYTVKAGDTLWSIAQRFGLENWTMLLQANPGLDPKDLKPGVRIVIPKREEKRPETPRPGPLEMPVVPGGPKEGRFIWPARGRVICGFGQPMPEEPDMICRGVVIAVAPGTKVLAAKSGVAFVMEALPGMGRTVAIDHGDGTVTMYGYNSDILVQYGDYVRQGEAIAVAGSTGRARSTEVFFRITRDSRPVDPLSCLSP